MKLEDFKDVFIRKIEQALNNQGRTLLDSEILIVNEFVNQAQLNGFTRLAK